MTELYILKIILITIGAFALFAAVGAIKHVAKISTSSMFTFFAALLFFTGFIIDQLT